MKCVWKSQIQPAIEGTRHVFDERGSITLEEVQRSILPCAAEGLSLTKGVAFSMKSRRKFLTTTLAMGLPAGILALMRGAQARGQRPQNPQTPKEDDPNPPRIDPKLVLEENQKEIKKSVEKLRSGQRIEGRSGKNGFRPCS